MFALGAASCATLAAPSPAPSGSGWYVVHPPSANAMTIPIPRRVA
jgi:hypothetical protein